ncbi:MAG: ABC transporter ATP-binding protein [Firmicutes bacterium]|nr:ABC transporter ATP-binding protein [Bacillota bacterium]
MLKTENLTKMYGGFTALDELSLEIERGKLHGFVGPNGAGKTTTMRILSALLPATRGQAWVDGVNVRQNPKRIRRLVGYMPDFFGVYDGLKVYEYLDFYGSCYGIPYKERVKTASQLLELVTLSDKREAYVDTLSRGMKQRLCLARSLIHDPALIILDEPASGMDPRARLEMKGILRSLKDLNKTVLVSSHILPELSEMCDSLSIIDHGALIFSGDMDELARRMRSESRLRVTVSGEKDEAIRLMKETAGLTRLEMDGAGVLSADYDGDAAVLLRRLVDGGVAVCDFHRPPVNLETVFMEVTRDDA